VTVTAATRQCRRTSITAARHYIAILLRCLAAVIYILWHSRGQVDWQLTELNYICSKNSNNILRRPAVNWRTGRHQRFTWYNWLISVELVTLCMFQTIFLTVNYSGLSIISISGLFSFNLKFSTFPRFLDFTSRFIRHVAPLGFRCFLPPKIGHFSTTAFWHIPVPSV